MAFLAFAFCRLPTLYPVFFARAALSRGLGGVFFTALFTAAHWYFKISRALNCGKLNCEHSVVELKAADRRAIRSGAMAWKISAREIVYELFKSAVPFYAHIKDRIR